MSNDQLLEVWYDGDCGVCRRSRAWCEERSHSTRFRFIDFRQVPDDRLPVSRHELESAMWVQTVDGELFGGFAGWRQILTVMPRWRWLAHLTGSPPLRWLGPPLYRLVARLRNQIPERRAQARKRPSV